MRRQNAVRALVFAALLFGGPAVAAEKAGVAAAVNPDAAGTPPGGASAPIAIGETILHNHLVETDSEGRAQILLRDRTAITVGPNATLVIDRFIYDPETGDGSMELTLQRGLLRFVGGAISKRRAAQVRTAVGTVGIRGGIALVDATEPGKVSAGFLFGEELTASVGGEVLQRIQRPGFGTVMHGQGATPPSRWSSGAIVNRMAALQAHDGQNGGLPNPPDTGALDRQAGRALPPADGLVLGGTTPSLFGGDSPAPLAAPVFGNETPTIREFNRPQEPLVDVPVDDGVVPENPIPDNSLSDGEGLINIPIEDGIVTDRLTPVVAPVTSMTGAH